MSRQSLRSRFVGCGLLCPTSNTPVLGARAATAQETQTIVPEDQVKLTSKELDEDITRYVRVGKLTDAHLASADGRRAAAGCLRPTTPKSRRAS